MKSIEDMDHQLARRVLNSSSKSSISLMMSELGWSSVRFIIKYKRLLYLHHLLTTKIESLAREVLSKQLKFPKKGDWIIYAKNDLIELGIKSSINEIASFSKFHFKNVLKKASNLAAFNHLVLQKAA